jgi:hypothetical protein
VPSLPNCAAVSRAEEGLAEAAALLLGLRRRGFSSLGERLR